MAEVRLGTRTLQPRRQLLAGSRRLPLGRRALEIISVLAEASGKIVTKDELLAAVWPGIVVEENALQVHVVALRKALGTEADRLKTIRGIGYQLQLGDGRDDQRPDAGHAAPARPPGVDNSGRASIVVLPFENLSADPEQDYFADGITEDIITDLSQVSALKSLAQDRQLGRFRPARGRIGFRGDRLTARPDTVRAQQKNRAAGEGDPAARGWRRNRLA